jgi:hypothetical protein
METWEPKVGAEGVPNFSKALPPWALQGLKIRFYLFFSLSCDRYHVKKNKKMAIRLYKNEKLCLHFCKPQPIYNTLCKSISRYTTKVWPRFELSAFTGKVEMPKCNNKQS